MATIKQKKAAEEIVGKRGNITAAMRAAGYSEKTIKNPKNLTESEAWKQLMAKHLSDDKLSKMHDELLHSTKIEHMTFPLGPKGEDDENLSGASPDTGGDDGEEDEETKRLQAERTTLTDDEIIKMLAAVNCQVKRIVHGETARHVYFWAIDAKSRKDALDMAYKLKGKYAPEKVDVTNNQAEEDRIVLRDLLRSLRKKNGTST